MIFSSAISYIETLFYSVPLAILPLLNAEARMDLLDLHKSQHKAVVNNSLGGETSLEQLDENSLTLRYTSASLWRMELQKDSTIKVTRTFFSKDTTEVTRIYNQKWKLISKPSTASKLQSVVRT
jgi:hypothetical protein